MTSSFNRRDQAPQWIRLAKLGIRWPEAQRALDERRARKIAAAFDPDAFQPVVVSLPDSASGLHHIIDGQHRVAAARLALGAEQCVACYVVNVATPAEAARVFGTINTERTAVQAIDAFRTAVTAGRQPEVAIDQLVAQLGYRIAGHKADGLISAVAACLAVVKAHRIDGLRDALLFIQGAWAKDRVSTDGTMIIGVAAFLARHGAAIDRTRLAQKLAKKFTAARFLAQVKARAETLDCNRREAMVGLLVAIHDDGLRAGRIDRRDVAQAAA